MKTDRSCSRQLTRQVYHGSEAQAKGLGAVCVIGQPWPQLNGRAPALQAPLAAVSPVRTPSPAFGCGGWDKLVSCVKVSRRLR